MLPKHINQPSDAPKVSVCVVTYNQEKYIRQCLQSIVDQETDFDFEVVVGDDCSTDGTRAIVSEFTERYAGIVKPLFHEKNMGAGANYQHTHDHAVGEYIAHVDGDDYCLPGKLQCQARILDADSGCNIVWHRMRVLADDGKLHNGPPHLSDDKLSCLRLDRGDILQFISVGLNSSKMYRRSVRDYAIPSFPVVDYYANVEQIGNGYARFVAGGYYGVYRSGIGISSQGRDTRDILRECFLLFSRKYPKLRARTNAAALTYLVADLRQARSTWLMFLMTSVQTFSFAGMPRFLRGLRFMHALRVRNV
jgi:glycosyltransferase involved in cell wall biosynthesis